MNVPKKVDYTGVIPWKNLNFVKCRICLKSGKFVFLPKKWNFKLT